jgi:hypothetical protein
MRAAKLERDASKKEGYISKSVKFKDDTKEGASEDEEDEDFNEEFYDSEELLYDSEEEDEKDRLFMEEQRKHMMNEKPTEKIVTDEGYDVNVEVKKVQKYRAAAGVKFTEYDEFGLSKKEGLGQFVSTDNGPDYDYLVEAPPEMLAKAYAKPRGVFRDYDKNVDELTVEGKYFATRYCWQQNTAISYNLSKLTDFITYYRKGRFRRT